MRGRGFETELVGRGEELRTLRDSFAAVRSGESRVAVVGGEAGTGKTRLVREFLAGLDAVPVVHGTCVALGQAAVPFLPLVGALRELRSGHGEAGLAELLTGPAAPLAGLVPRVQAGAAGPATTGGVVALYEGVLALLDRMAGAAPAVLVLEDLHWADASTLDLVRFLATGPPPGRLVLITYRSDEMWRRHPLRPLLAELARTPDVVRVEVERLREDDARDLVHRLAGPAATVPVERIVRRAEGNPFFIEELVVSSAEAGGRGSNLDDILRVRLDRLPEPARPVVQVMAAIGLRASHELLAKVAGLTEPDLADGLRAAIDERVVVADDGDYGFRHALLQEAAYDELLARQRLDLHHRTAQALGDDPGLAQGGAEAAAGEIAFHAERAGDLDTAFLASIRAGEHAYRHFAIAEAAIHYDRAVELRDRVTPGLDAPAPDRLLLRAARAALYINDTKHGTERLEAAVEAVPASEPLRRGYLLRELAQARWAAGDGTGTHAALERALALVGPARTVERASVLGFHGLTYALQDRPDEAFTCLEEALSIARDLGAAAEASVALNGLGVALVDSGRDPERGLACLHEAYEVGKQAAGPRYQQHAALNLGACYELVGRRTEGLAFQAQALAEFAAKGYSGGWVDFMTVNQVEALISVGEWDEAARLLPRLRFASNGITRCVRDFQASRLALLRGDDEAGAALLGRAEENIGTTNSLQFLRMLAQRSAQLALARNDLEALEGIVEQVLAFPPVHSAFLSHPQVARLAVESALASGHPGRGRAIIQALRRQRDLALKEATGDTADSVRRTGRLADAEATRLGEPDPDVWRDCLADLAQVPEVDDELYVKLRLAESYLLTGQAAEAGAVLTEAHQQAVQLGSARAGALEALARQARVRLAAVRPDDPVKPLDQRLTPREHEVLRLLVTGATNKDIAVELFISRKTASVHVSNILGKLGVANRTQAAAIGRDLGG